MIEIQPTEVQSLLARLGLSEMSTDDLAAHVCLVGAFGPAWRDHLDVPANSNPVEVWIEVLLATASTPEEGEVAVQRWWHGTGPWARS